MRYVSVAALSHEGLIRDHNEDSVVVGPWTLCATVTRVPATFHFPVGDPLVVAIADGLGGHPAGDDASSLVVRYLAAANGAIAGSDDVGKLIEFCHRALLAESRRDAARSGMATTIAGVVIGSDSVIVFNVGDSRVYAFGPRGLQLCSVDDNPPLPPGVRHTSVLTQSIGGFDPAPPSPHITIRELADDVSYLLCSDGLTDVVDDVRIAQVLEADDGARAIFELWRATIDAGAPDNISLALVEFGDTAEANGD